MRLINCNKITITNKSKYVGVIRFREATYCNNISVNHLFNENKISYFQLTKIDKSQRATFNYIEYLFRSN